MNTTILLTVVLILCALSSVLSALLVLSAVIQAGRRERSLTQQSDAHRPFEPLPAHTVAAESFRAAHDPALAATE